MQRDQGPRRIHFDINDGDHHHHDPARRGLALVATLGRRRRLSSGHRSGLPDDHVLHGSEQRRCRLPVQRDLVVGGAGRHSPAGPVAVGR
jgi:hypothetical protein